MNKYGGGNDAFVDNDAFDDGSGSVDNQNNEGGAGKQLSDDELRRFAESQVDTIVEEQRKMMANVRAGRQAFMMGGSDVVVI